VIERRVGRSLEPWSIRLGPYRVRGRQPAEYLLRSGTRCV